MCEISCKNSERLLRKWQKTLGDTFFAAHCTASNDSLECEIIYQVNEWKFN